MNRIQQLLSQLKALLVILLTRIEESSVFEKIVLSYEGLEQKSQNRIWSLLSIAVLVLTLGIVLGPVGYVVTLRSKIDKTVGLTQEISAQQTGTRTERRPAPLPTGWQNIPVTNASDLELVLAQFLANQGVGPNSYLLTQKGNLFSLAATEITLRQVLNFTFQIDGWHPAIVVKKFRLDTNRVRKDLVDFKIDFSLDTTQLNRFASGGLSLPSPETDGDFGEGMGAFNGGPSGTNFPPAPPTSSNSDPTGSSFQPPPSSMDSYNQDPFSSGEGPDIPPPSLPLEPLEEEF